MKSSSRLLTSLTLASFVFAAPVAAQESGSMAVGGATVTVGAGTAILTLPDVPSLMFRGSSGIPSTLLQTFKSSDDFGDEIGWNVNGSIALPMGANKSVSLNGFWANIDDGNSATCTTTAIFGETCGVPPLVDDPALAQFTGFGGLVQLNSRSEREVDHWGASLESKWRLNPGVMGVTRAPHQRTFALGADIRGIDQDLNETILSPTNPAFSAVYNEDLDTRYYGAYAAWGGGYSLPFLSGLTGGLGLRSSFLLRGGVYYADTDYSGRLTTAGAAFSANSALSLSDSDVAFIGGLVLETRKRIGRRAMLSLKSEYEYYTYVPEMAYNQEDVRLGINPVLLGAQLGTRIGSDDAFSARTSLRLTIKLGPDSVMEPR